MATLWERRGGMGVPGPRICQVGAGGQQGTSSVPTECIAYACLPLPIPHTRGVISVTLILNNEGKGPGEGVELNVQREKAFLSEGHDHACAPWGRRRNLYLPARSPAEDPLEG
ncbi:hypothetical protein JZ751_024874, partial [Albula glossodonta]